MKASYSSDLIALLQRNASVWPNTAFDHLYRAHLFKIGPLRNGQMIYATDAQRDLVYGGNTYSATAYGNWTRGAISSKVGLETAEMDLTVSASQQIPVYFPGTDALMIDGIKYGLMDAAPVTVYIYYSPVWGQMTGPTGGSLVGIKFGGEISETIGPIGITIATLKVHDYRYLLNIDIPQRQFSASCWWVLYSTGCTLVKSSFTKTGAVQALETSTTFQTTAHITPVSAAGTFTLGVITWTSGKNAGLASMVRLWTPNTGYDIIQLDVAPIFGVGIGDTFSIAQGCNKTFTSCQDLQGSTNAQKNFGGTPLVPVPETAIG